MKKIVDAVVNPAIIEMAGEETFDFVQEWVEKTRTQSLRKLLNVEEKREARNEKVPSLA